MEIDKFLRFEEVEEITGLSRTTIWRWEKIGKFPSHYLLYGSIAVWKLSEVMVWYNSFSPVHVH